MRPTRLRARAHPGPELPARPLRQGEVARHPQPLQEALDEALAASAAAPRDGEIHAAIGDIYERLNRYDEAVIAYSNYINLLPQKDRSDKAAWARAQVEFLDAFKGYRPAEIDQEDLQSLHTLPFKLVKDKIVVQARVNGGRLQDFVLDTGSEETVLSRETAQRERVRPITYTLSAGVGEVGLRGLQLGAREPARTRHAPGAQPAGADQEPGAARDPEAGGESFSPLSLGLSMMIDYQAKLLTIGKKLPRRRLRPSCRCACRACAMVRGVLNSNYPAYFVVDTGGEVISISADTASALPPNSFRRIPLKVWGTSGWDRDAFLLPGNDLDFDRIEYRELPAGGAEPARTQRAAWLPAGWHRRPQVPVELSRLHGPGAERAPPREELKPHFRPRVALSVHLR
jgi:predicted aspartyl protease